MKKQECDEWREHPGTRAVPSALGKHAKASRIQVEETFWASGTVQAEERLKVLMFEEVIDQISSAIAERIDEYNEQ